MATGKLDAFANDWQMMLAMEKHILGQSVFIFQIKSDSISTRSSAILSELSGKDLLDNLLDLANPLRAAAALIGTGTGPLATNSYIRLNCKKMFSLHDLDGAAGEIKGASAGFAFGYCSYSVKSPSFFDGEFSGLTASMMFPAFGTTSGRWWVDKSGLIETAIKADAPQSRLQMASRIS